MKKSLLFAMAVAFAMGVKAQMTDVTSQYIVNPGFEECEALVPNDKGEVSLIQNDKAPVDYKNQGWECIGGYDGSTAYNAGVAAYPIKVRYSKWMSAVGPTAAVEAENNQKGLCFTANKSAVYQQTGEITLPAGTYVLTVNVWAYNGQTSNPPATTEITNGTAFVAADGTKYLSKKTAFKTNAWDIDTIMVQLTAETKGRFRLTYGSSTFVVIDDLKLAYENKIITDELDEAIAKAGKLYDLIGSNPGLEAAIGAASQFAANPTTQDNVSVEAAKLYAAMGDALKLVTESVDITGIYIVNPSFEIGKMDGWEGNLSKQSPYEPSPYLDGECFAGPDYGTSGQLTLLQTVDNLPEGYYILDAKMEGSANLILGGTKTERKGGTAGDMFLRTCTDVLNSAGGSLTIGLQSTKNVNIDDIRLFYGPSESALLSRVLTDVKADAQTILAKKQFECVNGNERTVAQSLADGTVETASEMKELITLLNNALNAFVASKDNYDKLAKAQATAAAFTTEAYPFAKAELHQRLQDLLAQTVSTSADAATAAADIAGVADSIYVSNAYAEGMPNLTDYSANVLGGKLEGTAFNTAWRINNMAVRNDLTNKAYTDPKTGKKVSVFMGSSADYYNMKAGTTAYMEQNIEGLPVGKYVFAATMMAYKDLTVDVKIGGLKRGSFTGVGTIGGGRYGWGWNELVFGFEKVAEGNVMLRIEDEANTQYKEWYIDNIRIFGYGASQTDAISETVNNAVSARYYFDLQGRRVAQPTKGLYIVGGKKVLMK